MKKESENIAAPFEMRRFPEVQAFSDVHPFPLPGGVRGKIGVFYRPV